MKYNTSCSLKLKILKKAIVSIYNCIRSSRVRKIKIKTTTTISATQEQNQQQTYCTSRATSSSVSFMTNSNRRWLLLYSVYEYTIFLLVYHACLLEDAFLLSSSALVNIALIALLRSTKIRLVYLLPCTVLLLLNVINKWALSPWKIK